MRAAACLLSMLCIVHSAGWAQQAAAASAAVAPPATGTVSGRVTCVDTNLPARLAAVTLQSIDVKPELRPGERFVPGPPLRTYQTSLDGSFVVPKVKPGTYYVVVKQTGYLSPITQFTQAELSQPTPETLARIVKVVPVVSVEPGHTTNIEVRLERGAALAGTIRYDDGTPMVSMFVSALHRETKDKKEVWVGSHGSVTDDQGHYRVTGLPPGEYLPRVAMQMEDRFVSSVLGSSFSSSSSTRYELDFYIGDTPRESKAKPIKLADGETRDGADITIPVSKLHSVTGTLTDLRSGHVLNAGKLALLYDDGTEAVSTSVNKEDAAFHFEYVPEGEYTLSVTEAKDVTREEIPQPPGYFPPSQTKETILKEYGTKSQPLIVQNDVIGVVVAVPDKSTKPIQP